MKKLYGRSKQAQGPAYRVHRLVILWTVILSRSEESACYERFFAAAQNDKAGGTVNRPLQSIHIPLLVELRYVDIVERGFKIFQ